MYIILFIIGISLVLLNVKAIKKERNSFGNTFKLAEADLTENDIKIGELRREFAETITELQREIIDLRETIDSLQSTGLKFNQQINKEEKSEIDVTLKNNLMREINVINAINTNGDTNTIDAMNAIDAIKEFYDNNAKNAEISYNKHILQEQQKHNLSKYSDYYEKKEKIKGISHEFNENLNLDLDKALKEVEAKTEKDNRREEATTTSNNFKIEDVRNLVNKGLNVEEIAAQLNIGKGEVLLIKELYLR